MSVFSLVHTRMELYANLPLDKAKGHKLDCMSYLWVNLHALPGRAWDFKLMCVFRIGLLLGLESDVMASPS